MSMSTRTDRYGTTILSGSIVQVPTLPLRCKQQAASIPSLPTEKRAYVAACAVALVQEYPSLSAKQAVAYVVSRL